jgi:hypothetical protein
VVEVVDRLSGVCVDGSLLGARLRVSCENPVIPHSKTRAIVEADLARLIIKNGSRGRQIQGRFSSDV